MVCVKLLIPIIEKFSKRLDYYSKIFNIVSGTEEHIYEEHDISQTFYIRDMETNDQILNFEIVTYFGKIVIANITGYISQTTIGNFRFLVSDLGIKDYYYIVEYSGNTLYYDIKPYEILDYDEVLIDKIKNLHLPVNCKFIKHINAITNIITTTDSDIMAIKFYSNNDIKVQEVFNLLPNIKYVFVQDDFFNSTCWCIKDGIVVEDNNITLTEFAISLI